MDAHTFLFAARASEKPRHVLLTIALLAISAPSIAAWPNSYQSVTPLSSGLDRFAADACATSDGGVLAVYDRTDGVEISQLVKYDINGILQWKDSLATQANVDTAAKFQILDGFTSDAYVGIQYVIPPNGTALGPVSQEFHMDGSLEPAQLEKGRIFADGVHSNSNQFHMYCTLPWTHKILAFSPKSGFSATVDTDALQINQLTSAENPTNELSVFACTAETEQIGRRSAVYFGYFQEYPPELSFFPVLEEGPAVQSDPSLTRFNNLLMINWISEKAGNRRLYTGVISNDLVTPNAFVLNNIDNYVATSSTLGVPVFAAVQRPSPNPAEMDTLIGGLINPETGETAALTIASASDIKVKFLRQETNGDFSLVYSISEGGTNLLKVRRISGTSAATLWETTVADLGIAPDERIERYPNTFVSGNENGVLYILTRYDQPYTHNTAFNLVRLRADGQLGGG